MGVPLGGISNSQLECHLSSSHVTPREGRKRVRRGPPKSFYMSYPFKLLQKVRDGSTGRPLVERGSVGSWQLGPWGVSPKDPLTHMSGISGAPIR